MAKYIYPAIFSREGSFYNIRFPDIENCYTQGESLQDAYEGIRCAMPDLV